MKKFFLSITFFAISVTCFSQIVPAYVSQVNLLGWYPFNGNALNEFGTGKNGTVLGATLTADRFGVANRAYDFNGSTSYIKIDTAFFNVGWNNFTLSAWCYANALVNPYSINHNQPIINTLPHNGVEIAFNWNLTNKFSIWANQNPTPSGANWTVLQNGKTPTNCLDNEWTHVVLVKDSGKVYRIYLNGNLDTTYRATILASNYYCRMTMGRIDPLIAHELFYGKLDDYGIWDRSLFGCEVKRLYDNSPYSYVISQPASASVAPAASANFSIADVGVGNTYQWQENAGSGFVNLSSIAPYSGVTTPTLTIAGVTLAMSSYKYRCVVSGATPCVDTSAFGSLLVGTTGVGYLSQPEIVTIAPNPTTGDIKVIGAGKVDVKVYNSVGQLVRSGYHCEKVSIADLPSGLYTIKLFDKNGLLHYDKVIKE